MNETLKLSLEFIILTLSSMAYMVTIIVLISRKHKDGIIKSHITITSICLYWSIGEMLVILFYHYNRPYLGIVIIAKYLVSYFLCPVWLIFSLNYTGNRFIKNGLTVKKAFIILFPVIPLSFMALSNINGFFAYMVNGLVHYSYGFWIYMSVQLCYVVIATGLMLKYSLNKPSFIRKRTMMIIAGNILSILITILYYAFGLHYKMSNMDIVPSALVVSLLFQVIAAFKYRFLNIFPMALPGIVRNMHEGIIIIDSESKIVFFNKALSGFFRGFDQLRTGMYASELSHYIRVNGKYEKDGKDVIEAIGKGSFQNLNGEIELLDGLQLQINYQPLFINTELIGWIVSIIDVGEYKFLLKELNEKNKRLSDAYSRLLEHAQVVEELAAARERNKLANEIHDSLGHSLSILLAHLEVAKLGFKNDMKTSEEKINAAYKVVKSSLTELRMTVSNLSSTKLEGYNLLDALESLKEGFESTGAKVELSVNGKLNDNLTDEIGTAIYSICRESLTNSLKHGEATLVSIILRLGENKVELFIFDNGRGCTDIAKGMGLSSMENRVHGLDGKILFGSDGEKGFSLHVEIPFK